MKKSIYGVGLLICVLVLGGYYYAVFPAINIHESVFWISATLVLLIVGAVLMLNRLLAMKRIPDKKEIPWYSKLFFMGAGLCVVVLLVSSLISSSLFRAKSYASLLKVEECDFATDMSVSIKVTDIALMDTDSARIFGSRKIGSLSSVVSQFEVENEYCQINISGSPMKVSSLKYASFFKWWNNRKNGVPGYVKVNPVNSEAEYVKLDQGMKYLPSGYFNYNLQRHVQLKYPTKIIDGYNFEVDDNGVPYYICPTKTARVGLFGGMDVNGAIICNPVDGSCQYYPVKEVPSWVDCVYAGNLLTQKYNWFGTLSDGFLNSVIGQSGCKMTTDDFGYKTIGDDVWIYTGVTSVTGDQSNIGFVLMNQRTSEAKYYPISGAEEHSAMDSAEGQVQEKGYVASFPSLINVNGTPTYIMVLKDASGLVKMYAMVNVEQYNIVATASTQSEVFSNYKKLLASNGKDADIDIETQEAMIQVADIQYIETVDGTVVYIKDTNHAVYKQAFSENESLIKISVGDQIKVVYEPMEDGINYLTEYTFQ